MRVLLLHGGSCPARLINIQSAGGIQIGVQLGDLRFLFLQGRGGIGLLIIQGLGGGQISGKAIDLIVLIGQSAGRGGCLRLQVSQGAVQLIDLIVQACNLGVLGGDIRGVLPQGGLLIGQRCGGCLRIGAELRIFRLKRLKLRVPGCQRAGDCG